MIPNYEPWITDLEKKYAMEAIDSGWISSTGKFVDQFEKKFAEYIGVKYAVATSSGTTACHIALEACGLKAGDEVIIPNTTFIATANACKYAGLDVAMCDISPKDWNMELKYLEGMIGSKTRAIFAVHLYGVMNNMDELSALCKKYNLILVEDACEALGGTWDGKRAGSFGKAACFSFYGNKTLTTGEGGMVVTNDEEVYRKAKLLKGQGQTERYFHPVIGYNYRMTNVVAAIGLAQLERVNEIMIEKKRVFDRYDSNLVGKPNITVQEIHPKCQHAYWVYALSLPNGKRNETEKALKDKGVETRRCFYPISTLPPYRDCRTCYSLFCSYWICETGLVLPSHPTLTNEQIDYICETIIKACG